MPAGRPFRDRRFRFASLTAAAVVGILAILLFSLPLAARQVVSSVGLIAFGLFGVGCGFWRWRRSGGRRARAWLILICSAVLAAIGNTWGLLSALGTVTPHSHRFSQSLITLAYLLAVVALWLFPAVRRRGTEMARMVLDGVVIGGSLLLLSSVTVFPQLLRSAQPVAERIDTLVIPVADVLIATVAALLILRSGRADRMPLVLVGSGFLCYGVSDLAYAVLFAHGGDTLGSPLDVGWFCAYGLLALGALHRPAAVVAEADDTAEPSTVLGTVVLFALFVAASLVSLLQIRTEAGNAAFAVVWVVVILGVLGRQILLVVDNERLRRGLEQRVAARTRELHQSTRRQELLLSSVGDGIYGVDEAGTITFVNPAGAAILGRDPAALIGQDAHTLFHAPNDEGTPFPADGCYISEAIRLGRTAHLEEDCYLRSDGSQVCVDVTASPLGHDDGIHGAVVIFRDVTERREVDRMKNEFVSIVSHELRTPLTSIRGSLGLVVGGAFGALPGQAERMLTIALESSDRLTRLINDILDIERIESGNIPMNVEACHARVLVDEARRQVAQLSADAAVRVELGDVAGSVYADPDRIVQTLINLLGNAVKFSPPGGTITVTATPQGSTVEFAVADQGRGIPEAKLDAIFGRFIQVDSSDARLRGGTGLGLAISRSIVERLGGRIWAESEDGLGTTFRFTLPQVSEPAALVPANGPCVVVCDDDPAVAEVLCTVLCRYGYRATAVTSGDEALAVVRTESPAALVLDLRMSGTSGADVVSALRASAATASIPVVIVSGLAPSRNPELAAETDGWLVKPIDGNELAATVALAIERHACPSQQCPSPEPKVLIVEDDDHLASVLQALLQRRGLSVSRAKGQREALRMILQSPPQVVILDLALPDGSGFGLVSKLRSAGHLQRLPLVVYSAADVRPEERDRLALGRTVFLTKGRITPQQLEQRVVELMDHVTGRGGAPPPASLLPEPVAAASLPAPVGAP